ncbi:uncharacterized protein KGF55_003639 [Candida pseudojiufengensis]|uniref:uncharacterized protein n=1 Tax=Candida pseudojiufengensis TaxID=497109 RepID=UPI002224702B|nr:uncharacterized protein KGF55_003639 [Candida pseudojiufengensis]KAI5962563.1 hypothetical protein KGF55_003639 [Candida pseudojiufengensis]
MVDPQLIRTHNELRLELSKLVTSNELRAFQITTAILKLGLIKQNQIASKKVVKSSPKKKQKGEETSSHYFEIELNKLKQQYSTESKLKDVKLDSFKKENERLKSQIKKLNSTKDNRSKSSNSNRSSNFFKSQRNRVPSGKSIFTPDKFNSSNSTNLPFYKRSTFSTIFDDELMTPIKKEKNKIHKLENKFKNILNSSASNDLVTKLNDVNEIEGGKEEDGDEVISVNNGPRATSSPSAIKLNTNSKYIENFDNEDDGVRSESESGKDPKEKKSKPDTESPSPEFTPQRRPRMTRSVTSSGGQNTSIGANSTLTSPTMLMMNKRSNSIDPHQSPTNTNKIRRIKKIKQVTKSIGSNDNTSSQIKKENSIFDDEVSDDEIETSFNILNKFEDSNFTNDAANTSIAVSKKIRKLEDVDDETAKDNEDEPVKKKRNVFTIE